MSKPAPRQRFVPRPIVAGLGALQAVAPVAAGAVAERLWFRPPRPSAQVLARHADLLAEAEALTVRVGGRMLRGWTLGDGPQVMLVHGWGGWAGQFGPIAVALAARGLRATSIDLPGHGTDRAPRSDLFQFADALRALAEQQGRPDMIVAHSIGALTAAMVFDGPPPPAAVFVAPMLSTGVTLDVYAQIIGLRPATARELRRRVKAFIGETWPLVNPGADLDWPRGPLLVVHDRNDPQAPYALSAALAERRAHVDLHAVDGLSHNRVLRDDAVVRAVADFAARHGQRGGVNDRNAAGLATSTRSSNSSPPAAARRGAKTLGR